MATSAVISPGAQPASAHYIWSFPGSVTVLLNLDVVERLQNALRETRQGLLLGTSTGAATEISGFRPLSDAEVAGMRATGSLPPSLQGLSPAGYFRTQTEGDLKLNADDLALAEAAFHEPHQVFLIIQTRQAGPALATFFFWDQGRMYGDFAFLEFPFDSAVLASRQTARQPISPREKIRPAATPSSSQTLRRFGFPWKAAASIIIAIALVGLGARLAVPSRFAPGRAAEVAPTPAPPAPAVVSLGLQVERHGPSDLKLIWDHQAPIVASATSGTLMIQDGPTPRVIPMDTALVRGGSLLYSPVSDEVQMRLTLERPGQPPATEMALIILPKGKAPEVKPLSVKKAAPSLTAGLPVEEPAAAQAAVETEALKPFVPPPSDFKREPVATAVLGAPPAVSSPAAPAAIPANPAAYPVPARPIPEAKPPAAAPPVQTRAVAPPVETEAAEAISQVMPVVPRLFRRPVFKPETVKIAVSIDQNGNVSSVRPSAPGNVPRALIQSAETAAMQWKFKPARIGDRPVPSETILIFKFEPRP